MSQIRKRHTANFKAKVAIDSIREDKTSSQLASHYKVATSQISTWKKHLVKNAAELFSSRTVASTAADIEAEKAPLYEEIGRLKMEIEWLKKNLNCPINKKRSLIEPNNSSLSIAKQCELLGLSRSSYYTSTSSTTPLKDLQIMQDIDKIYTQHPCFGSRRINEILNRDHGYTINRKRVQRLMRLMGIQGISPKTSTSKQDKEHTIYPYLLRNLNIEHPNQVWSSDITYIPLEQGFMYLVAIIDWYSRYVISWELSNTLDTEFCISALHMALKFGCPDIFNTDQGAQFTSNDFVKCLLNSNIKISMDGRGRALDNVFIERFWRSVKYENIYLQSYQNPIELRRGLASYIEFYNDYRPHQSLNYNTPKQIHFMN
jgi:putative transposase